MRRVLFLCFLFLPFAPATIFAQNKFVYQSLDNTTGKIVGFSYLALLPNDKMSIWESKDQGKNLRETVHYDASGSGKKWAIKDNVKNTNCEVTKEGETIILKGWKEGRKFAKTYPVKQWPFYLNAKVELRSFILSDLKEQKYWTLREDNLLPVLMLATKKGNETIAANDHQWLAQKILIAPVGISAMFFQRDYWFRDSDGIYLKSEGSNKVTRVLIEETGGSI